MWELVTKDCPPRDYAVQFWDGTRSEPESARAARFTLVLNHPGALRQMLWPLNKCGLGESYIYDDIDIQGDIERFFELTMQMHRAQSSLSMMQKFDLFKRLESLPDEARPRPEQRAAHLTGDPHSPDRDREAVQYHYDTSNDFFALCLDQRMVYTCAYYKSPTESLEVAQERKLDNICRKLRLKPGMRMLDIGSGWGGLVMHAAANYGVRAVGVTLSREQHAMATDRIHAAGLAGNCEIQLRDYREMNEPESFDAITSIEMYEAVGAKELPNYFSQVGKLLKCGGAYLHQGITIRPFMPTPPWFPFGLRYVFPDGELVTIDETLKLLAGASLEPRDVECRREHYVLTLQEWLRRLEANHDRAVRVTDEINYRIFRIYFAAAAYGFKAAMSNLFQVLSVKAGEGPTDLPLTRRDWYKERSMPTVT